MNEFLRNEVKAIKEKYGITYQVMAKNSGINKSSFTKFVGGFRGLSEENQKKLKEYVESIGYTPTETRKGEFTWN